MQDNEEQLKADRQLQERFKRSAAQLESWRNSIEGMPVGDARNQLFEKYAKVDHLTSYVAERMNELHMARENGLDWLRNDAIAKLVQYEASLEELRTQLSISTQNAIIETAQAPVQATARQAVSNDPPRERTSVIQQMRQAASTQMKTSTQPTAAEGRRSVIREMRAEAAVSRPAPGTLMPEFAKLASEVGGWRPKLESLASLLRSIEQTVPAGESSITWRRKVSEVQTKHRRAMEKVGRCRGWIRAGAARLSSGSDWERDFALAREEFSELDHDIKILQAQTEAEDEPAEAQAKEAPKTQPIRTIKFGPSSDVGARAMGIAQ